jgi:integrase/recombinase XerD
MLLRYLPPEDIERVITDCNSVTAIGIRDKAIILLLARLGLRAGEVAALKLDDIFRRLIAAAGLPR